MNISGFPSANTEKRLRKTIGKKKDNLAQFALFASSSTNAVVKKWPTKNKKMRLHYVRWLMTTVAMANAASACFSSSSHPMKKPEPVEPGDGQGEGGIRDGTDIQFPGENLVKCSSEKMFL
jgi:hypothetical protein